MPGSGSSIRAGRSTRTRSGSSSGTKVPPPSTVSTGGWRSAMTSPAGGQVFGRPASAPGTDAAAVCATAYATLFTIAAAAIVASQIPVTRRTARLPAGPAMLTGAALQGAGLAALVFARYGYPVLVIA